MVTNCAPLHANLFLYGYEAEFIQGLLKSGKNTLLRNSILPTGTQIMLCLRKNQRFRSIFILSIHVNVKLKIRAESNTSALLSLLSLY